MQGSVQDGQLEKAQYVTHVMAHSTIVWDLSAIGTSNYSTGRQIRAKRECVL